MSETTGQGTAPPAKTGDPVDLSAVQAAMTTPAAGGDEAAAKLSQRAVLEPSATEVAQAESDEETPRNRHAAFVSALTAARHAVLAAGKTGHVEQLAAAVAAAFDVLLTTV
jgi:hypothetical protein